MFLFSLISLLFVVLNVLRSEHNLVLAFQDDPTDSDENIPGKLKDAPQVLITNYSLPFRFNMDDSEIKRSKRETTEIINSESNTEDISGTQENQQILLTKRNLRVLTNMTRILSEYFTVLEEKFAQNQREANSTNVVLIQLKEHAANHQKETTAINSMMLQMLSTQNSTFKEWAESMKTKDETLLEYCKKENIKLVAELDMKSEIQKNCSSKIDSLNATIEKMKEEIRLLKLNNNQQILEDTRDSFIQMEVNHSETFNKFLELIMLQQNHEINQISVILPNASKQSIDVILAAVKNETEIREQKISVHQFSETMKNISNLQKTVDELKRIIGEKSFASAEVLQSNVTVGERQALTYLNNGLGTNQNVKNRESLLKYLGGITGSKSISGLFVTISGSNSTKGVEILNTIAGKSPGIISTNIPSHLSNVTQWKAFVTDVTDLWNQCYLVHIVWRWDRGHPLTSISIFDDNSNATDEEKRWIDLITDGGHLNQEWKKHLDLLAHYLHQLQTAGVIAIVDILPAITDKDHIWRGRPGMNGSAKLYKITHEYLIKHHNLTSFIWAWSIYSGSMSEIENFWPGSDYVDVASVIMLYKQDLSINDYQKLVEVAGEIPLSMDMMYNVPTSQLLAAQPRWTWFTADDSKLENANYNNNHNINTVMNSIYVANKENVDFFNNTN